MTGVAVPSYYNIAAVNPVKYAEQLKKRKMLWSKVSKETADKEKEVSTVLCQTCDRYVVDVFFWCLIKIIIHTLLGSKTPASKEIVRHWEHGYFT